MPTAPRFKISAFCPLIRDHRAMPFSLVERMRQALVRQLHIEAVFDSALVLLGVWSWLTAPAALGTLVALSNQRFAMLKRLGRWWLKRPRADKLA
jgi:hypothetical protein